MRKLLLALLLLGTLTAAAQGFISHQARLAKMAIRIMPRIMAMSTLHTETGALPPTLPVCPFTAN